MSSDGEFVMNDLRIKFAVFWFFIAGAMLGNTILYFVVPDVKDEIRAGGRR